MYPFFRQGGFLSALIFSTIWSGCFQPCYGESTGGEASDAEVSYQFGYQLGAVLKQQGMMEMVLSLDLGSEEVLSGLVDSLADQPSALSQEKQQLATGALKVRQDRLAGEQEAERDRELLTSLEEARAFMQENGRQAGVVSTASGLQYQILEDAAGEKPGPADIVTVHYVGTLTDGVQFDSSRARNAPVEFPLNRVIPGWTEGLQLMSRGARYRFFIPPELGYGPGGTGSIPPNAVLVF